MVHYSLNEINKITYLQKYFMFKYIYSNFLCSTYKHAFFKLREKIHVIAYRKLKCDMLGWNQIKFDLQNMVFVHYVASYSTGDRIQTP